MFLKNKIIKDSTTVNLSNVGLFNTPPHGQHYWVWFVDINGEWSDNGNLITSGSIDLGESSDTILVFHNFNSERLIDEMGNKSPVCVKAI
jgi:hypothetical protein